MRPVKAILLIADILDRGAHSLLDLFVANRIRTAHLTQQSDAVGRGCRLARHPHKGRIKAGSDRFAKVKIDNLVGDAIANLIRVAFGNTLAGEQKIRHGFILFRVWPWCYDSTPIISTSIYMFRIRVVNLPVFRHGVLLPADPPTALAIPPL